MPATQQVRAAEWWRRYHAVQDAHSRGLELSPSLVNWRKWQRRLFRDEKRAQLGQFAEPPIKRRYPRRGRLSPEQITALLTPAFTLDVTGGLGAAVTALTSRTT
eukprot:INCI12522.1.p3 GENE.INCI12522.1~~INCI12522.1.p3  ORF type:complete len:104 (+),score=4.88 INCI12522.1:351-662(+)